jgi:hypothetical protein
MGLLHRTRTEDHTDDATDRTFTTGDDTVVDRSDRSDHTMVDRDTTTERSVVHDDRPAVVTPTKVRERVTTFAPGQLVSLAAGILAIVVGLIAVIRCGLDGSLGTPVESVLGYDHTAWTGFIEIGAGVLLVVAGLGAAGRPLSVLVGLAAVVAGVLILAETDAMPDELGLEREFGWPVAVLGGVVVLASLLIPVWRTHHRDPIDLREDRAETVA